MTAPTDTAPDATSLREVVLITGISGSGKSVALHALEDANFFCVDNLPPELLPDFIRLEAARLDRRVAVAVDVRSAGSLPYLLPMLQQLRAEGVAIQVLFLDASTDALVRRFSETRRPHPLSAEERPQADDMRRPLPEGEEESGKATFPHDRPQADAMRRPPPEGDEESGKATFPHDRPQADAMRRPPPEEDEESGKATFPHEPQAEPGRRDGAPAADTRRALIDAIELERELLSELRGVATVLDTSQLRATQLRVWVRDMVSAGRNRLTLVFESFAFKFGVPLDADYVFDVRVLPNPHYLRELRDLTGCDAPVAEFLRAQPEAVEMLDQIEAFLARWLPAFEDDQRSYLTVAIGCTGGQHRSVYFVQMLAERFRTRAVTLIRHRELDAHGAASPH